MSILKAIPLERVIDPQPVDATAPARERSRAAARPVGSALVGDHNITTPVAASLIVSSREFVEGFVPPDYLIDGILQRRFCYSFTAKTGTGKTALLLLIAAHVALGKAIGEIGVERGRVLYFAGENPDDVRMRWIAMAERMGFDTSTIDVHFLPGTPKLSEIESKIREKVQLIGDVSCVIVDTSAAYFEGDDENGNVQMGVHARRMRSLTTLPGKPCVIVACHPVKNATVDNLLPRGGGAYIAEMDGNLTGDKTDHSVVTLHWQGKFRGPDFAPLLFQLHTLTTDKLKDTKGRLVPTVVATPLSERERVQAEAGSRNDEDVVLAAMLDHDRASLAGLATALQWLDSNAKPYKSRVDRAMKRLKVGKFVGVERGTYVLTVKGKAEASRARYNAAAAGATYG